MGVGSEPGKCFSITKLESQLGSLRPELRLFEGNRPPDRRRDLIARPDDIFFSADLPKTRSGKIMRRLLKDIAEGRALGDTTTLADPAVVSRLKDMYESKEA